MLYRAANFENGSADLSCGIGGTQHFLFILSYNRRLRWAHSSLAFCYTIDAIFFLNKKEGALWCTAFYGILCLLLLQPFPTGTYEYEKAEAIHLLLTLLFIIFIAYQLESSRSNYSDRLIEEHTMLKKEKQNLENALEQVNTLSGMLPICASCKKIRDDKGYWNMIEEYLAKRSDLKFSHGICPGCAKRLYPDLKINSI